jgi:lipid-binding SYLF domain-containing protein
MDNTIKVLLSTSALYFACAVPAAAEEIEPAQPGIVTAASDEAADAQETVQEASQVVEQLRSDPETREALSRAKAVFIVPDYGRASLGVGGAGGEGVLVANNNGNWSAPAFYNIGTINLGLEAGAEGGSIAFLVMSDKALEGFREQNNFSLNADAGLTIVDWSKRAQASLGKGADVIAWSDTEGLYGDLAVSVTDILWDGEANRAYYQKTVDAAEIINGNVQTPQEDSPLKSEFSALEEAGPAEQTPEAK